MELWERKRGDVESNIFSNFRSIEINGLKKV